MHAVVEGSVVSVGCDPRLGPVGSSGKSVLGPDKGLGGCGGAAPSQKPGQLGALGPGEHHLGVGFDVEDTIVVALLRWQTRCIRL